MTEPSILELKGLIETIGRTFETFKNNHNNELTEIKKGRVDGLTREEGEKINKALTEMVAEKDKILLRLKAIQTGAMEDGKLRPEHVVEAEQAYHKYLRKGAHSTSDGAFHYDVKGDITVEQKAMSVISDPDGGYQVTPDLSGRVVKQVFESSDIRSVCSVQAIGTDALEGQYDLNEASFGWVAEQGQRPVTNTPQLGKWRIPVHEMYAMPSVTQKLIDDANFNPEAWLADKLADKFSRVENAAFVNGDGVGKPRGFLTYASGSTLPGTVAQVNSGSAGNFTPDTLFDLIYALKTIYRRDAMWGLHRLSMAAIRKLKDSQNRYLWEPGLNGQQQQTLLGYGIQEFNDMPTPASGALAAVFANFKEFYQVVDRVGIRVLRDPYTSKGSILFYTTRRVGGDVLNFEAAKLYKLT